MDLLLTLSECLDCVMPMLLSCFIIPRVIHLSTTWSVVRLEGNNFDCFTVTPLTPRPAVFLWVDKVL